MQCGQWPAMAMLSPGPHTGTPGYDQLATYSWQCVTLHLRRPAALSSRESLRTPNIPSWHSDRIIPPSSISTFSHISSSPSISNLPGLTPPGFGTRTPSDRVTSVRCPMMVQQQVQAPEDQPCARQQQRFHRICVFCGSSRGNKGIFTDVASSLGQELVSRKIDLVYGGGGNGLMGHVAKAVHDGGGHVVGVIPKALIGQEISGQTVGKLVAVSDMHQRKAEMARQADAFIALPGGYGTLEELLEVITWSQLGIHEKPVGLLNVDGYYNPLLALFDKALEEGFLKFSARSIVVSAPTPSELLDKLEAYTPILDPRAPKLCWEDAERLVYAPAQ